MEFSTKASRPDRAETGCIVVGVMESRVLLPAGQALDRASRGHITAILARGDMDGRPGTTLMLHGMPRVSAERILLVGLGRERDLGDKRYREACRVALRALADCGAQEAVFALIEAPVRDRDAGWKARQAVIAGGESAYRFDRMKSKPTPGKVRPRRLVLDPGSPVRLAATEHGMREGVAIAEGMKLAKDLGNLPGNVCTPTYLTEEALALGKKRGIRVNVLERADMEELGMGALLSVARGSVEPPKLFTMEYGGGLEGDAPVVLIGKGITFDTGGISLKPGAEMDEMKFDMCGAASVVGTMHAIAAMKLPLNVVGIVPTTENMPGGRATKPGDIVTTMSGKTVEILNTDAEGRLILCDALTYAARFKPAVVIDIATLTGACVIALGHVASGLFSNDDALAGELLAAGETSGDRAWRMPVWEEYQEQLKSNFADMANIGGRPAGSVTAACYLARFAEKYRWAHLDIAGVAWKSGREKGSTGRPVPLLTQYLIDRASTAAKA